MISLLGNDFVNFVCLPLLLPIHSMATQAKIFMMGKNRDFTPRSLFKAKQSTQAQHKLKQNNILTEKDMKNHKAVYAFSLFYSLVKYLLLE